ncbi:MAG: iron-containing alcohol dehydrogenase family protein [Clostridium sp.]
MKKVHNNTVCFSNYTIGKDALRDLNHICNGYGSRILVIGGHKAIEAVKEKLEDSINKVNDNSEEVCSNISKEENQCDWAGRGLSITSSDINLKITGYEWYGGECTYKNMNRLTEIALSKEAEIIIAVGGGKAIDTAKGVGDRLELPIITIPTIASTCAATTALSVVYDERGEFHSFNFMKKPAVHCFIDTDIIAKAPVKYLRAGIGDTIAKYYECTLASRGEELSHSSAMAREISKMCVEPILKYGEEALLHCEKGESTFEVEQVILNNIVSTGLVSMLIDEKYNGAIAHSLFYGLALLEHIEKNYLHGDVVGYGVLVQLAIDKDLEELKRLHEFFKRIGIPTSLKDIEVEKDLYYLDKVLQETIDGPDMKDLPYVVIKEMVFDAIKVVEDLGEKVSNL